MEKWSHYHQFIIKFREMEKRKIVVKVTMINEKKARKALQIVVSVCGVVSASFVGSEKDQIAVTGEGIDPVELTKSLRKSVGSTEIISVGPVDEKKPSQTQATVVSSDVYPSCYYGAAYYIYDAPSYNNPTCTIL